MKKNTNDKYTKLISKLKELGEKLDNLKNKKYLEGERELYEIQDLIERIIRRIYPEKDAKNLISKLYFYVGGSRETTEYEKQKKYLDMINKTQKTIKIILEEYELFGFDDFEPIKEQHEFSFGFGKTFFRKKKVK